MSDRQNARMPMGWLIPCLAKVLIVCLCLCGACSRNRLPPAGPPVLTLMPTGDNPTDLAFLMREMDRYRQKTGIQVSTLGSFDSMDARLNLFQSMFAKKSPEPDICEVDNIWPGLLGDDLLDLTPYLGDEMKAIDKSLLEAFTVQGRLVALPLGIDTAVLYYRTDLLKKYGYRGPPETWDELGRMAKVIQDGERKAGAKDFWGYVWQGVQGEALTCNAMEWQHAEGADLIDRSGAVCANSPAAESALRRARSWVGTISPRSVVEYDEEDSANLWLAGSAAFTRGWLTLYGLSRSSPLLANRFSAAHLPAGKKGYGWVFGGDGLGVSRYSLHPKEAAQVVRYLSSPEVQKRRLNEVSSFPSRTSVLDEAVLLPDTVFSGWLSKHWSEGMFVRPSAQTGKNYAAISTAYSRTVHDVIAGKDDPHEALMRLQAQVVALMQSANGPHQK